MRRNAFVLAVVLVALGVAVNLRGTARSTVRTKAWVASHTPTSVGDYHTVPGPDGSDESYQMVLPQLNASAIVARTMTNGKNSIDVVVVHSDRGESFHDPAGCFKAQEWEIIKQDHQTVATQTQGSIVVNNLSIRARGGQPVAAAYCFRKGRTLFADQADLLRALFLGELLTARSQEGTMYRFIALNGGASQDELLKFVGDYMDKAMELNRGE